MPRPSCPVCREELSRNVFYWTTVGQVVDCDSCGARITPVVWRHRLAGGLGGGAGGGVLLLPFVEPGTPLFWAPLFVVLPLLWWMLHRVCRFVPHPGS